MRIGEFLEALKIVEPTLVKAQNSGTSEDFANLMIMLALHGLVIIPINEEDVDIPQPICHMTFMVGPSQIWNRKPNCYLIPADQISS